MNTSPPARGKDRLNIYQKIDHDINHKPSMYL